MRKGTTGDHISVCVCTYHRNVSLERLLRHLAVQETSGLFDVSIVVVDNDGRSPAKELVTRLAEKLELPIEYDTEPTLNLYAARNRALRLARGNYVAMIDDDEFPPAHWLLTLYRGIHAYKVDGCLGPVLPFFEAQPPAWLEKAKFCERPVHRTGTLLRWEQTRTGNVLSKKEVFGRSGLRFDERFKTGGGDREFFKRAMDAGFRFVAVEEAPVYEVVPPERWTRIYYLRRSLLNGANADRIAAAGRCTRKRLIALLRSSAAACVYSVALPLCACAGWSVLMQCLERGAHHLGRLFSGLGVELMRRRDS